MATNTFPALDIQPLQQQANPMEQFQRLMQIRAAQQQMAYQQQMQPLQLQAEQDVVEQQKRGLQQQRTLLDLAPQYVKRDAQGNVAGYDWDGYYNAAMGSGDVDPNKIAEMRTQQATMQKTLADAGSATIKLQEDHANQAYQQVEGVRDLINSNAPPASIQFAYQNALRNVAAQGYDTSKYPQQYTDLGKVIGSTDPKQGPLQALTAFESTFGMHKQQLADAKEIADTSEAAAKARIDNMKANMAANSHPGDFDTVIDQAANPKGPNAALGARTKLMVNAALGRSDYETAQKILDQMNQQIGSREHEVMIQGQENLRQQLNREAMFLNTQQQQGVQALQQTFNDPRSGFGEFRAQYNQSKNLLMQAKNGSDVAAAMAPLALILGQNSFAQNRRISPSEVNAVGPQMGSYLRQAETWFDKNGMGAIPAASMKEMNGILDSMLQAKYNEVSTQAKYTMSTHNLDPNTTPVMDINGNVTTLGGGAPTAPTPFVSTGRGVQKAAPVTQPTQSRTSQQQPQNLKGPIQPGEKVVYGPNNHQLVWRNRQWVDPVTGQVQQ